MSSLQCVSGGNWDIIFISMFQHVNLKAQSRPVCNSRFSTNKSSFHQNRHSQRKLTEMFGINWSIAMFWSLKIVDFPQSISTKPPALMQLLVHFAFKRIDHFALKSMKMLFFNYICPICMQASFWTLNISLNDAGKFYIHISHASASPMFTY